MKETTRYIILFLLLFSILQAVAKDRNSLPASNKTGTEDSISYVLTRNNDQTYGYDIFVKGRKLIHQPTIPCMPGNSGFKKKDDARKAAVIVMDMIRKNIMPPTLTKEDMRKAGIII